ncbi:uncharacterized protein EMPS_00230 [Entomortierella parvispora]|uniref:Uncharacterized protein n=1 Tax=Entomortierella parvispora TaxID=205924 RepID=A0A9P3LRF8_9FUNG|nr:uncharacterized protein EMPS_00230 [Entomortierella parvispora]
MQRRDNSQGFSRSSSLFATSSSVELPAVSSSGVSPLALPMKALDDRSVIVASTSVEDMDSRKAIQSHELLAITTTTATTTSTELLPEMDSTPINPDEHGSNSATSGFPLEKPVTEEPSSSALPTTPHTPRVSRPKPSPISTRALKRAGSLPLNNTNPSRDIEESGLISVGSNTRLDCCPSSTTTKSGQEKNNCDAKSRVESHPQGDGELEDHRRYSGDDECSADEGGRDSGIALEKWDVPQRLLCTTSSNANPTTDAGTKACSAPRKEIQTAATDQPSAEKRKEAFPIFSQLLYFTQESFNEGDVLAPTQQQLQSGNRRRQRCQSWMHPKASRETDSDDTADLWSRSDMELEPKGDLLTRRSHLDDAGEGTKSTAAKRKTRPKRVSSMIFDADFQLTLDAFAHGLPPLPPMPPQQQTTKTAALATPSSSFFRSPSSRQQGATKNRDIDNSSSSRQTVHSSNFSSSSASSSTSSSSSSTFTTLNLSRSPPASLEQQLAGLSSTTQPQTIPFSNLLDLATAKAENITGLYFARQLNMAANQPSTIYSQNNSSNSTFNHQQHHDPQEHFLNSHESSLSSPKTERVDVPTPALTPSAAPMQINVDLASPANNISHTSELTRVEADLKVMGTQEAPRLGLACARTISNLPPLPAIHPVEVTSETTRSRRVRAVTSHGSMSEQQAASLSGYSFSAKQEERTGPDNIDDGLALEASRPSLSAIPTGGKPSHRRSHSASHFFHLSSLKHHSPAQFNLALCYEHGQGGVEQDLAKAIYFYQQAADQGHTKASYNIGCICYNLGEIRKAIAWFEGAGKCRIRGLDETPVKRCPLEEGFIKPQRSEPDHQAKIQCPIPRQSLLFPHELEDFLGAGGREGSCGSGPFTVYLPAILCLALLCRQGIKDPRDESVVILRKDPVQATELLQRLVQKAPSSLPPVSDTPMTGRSDSARSLNMEKGEWADGRRRQAISSQSSGNPLESNAGQLHTTSLFSSSCPSLNLGESKASPGSSGRIRNKRASFVEDAVDDEADSGQDCRRLQGSPGQAQAQSQPQSQPYPSKPASTLLIPPPGSADAHESWAVQLAQRLLTIWQSGSSDTRKRGKRSSRKDKVENSGRKKRGNSPNPSSSSSQDQRILRYHLLYITNPTLSKNLYNLGVLYDLYLDDRPIAIQCYTFAFQNSTPPVGSSPSCPLSLSPIPAMDRQLITMRINCAWNLGVLYVKLRRWQLAREWFLCAQHDIQLFDMNEDQNRGKDSPPDGTCCHRRGGGLLDKGVREQKTGYEKTLRDGGDNDSPSMRHARKHGVWMNLSSLRISRGQSLSSSLPSSSAASVQQPAASAQLSSSSPCPPSAFCSKEEGSVNVPASGSTNVTTDRNKIALVLQWIDSKQDQ